MISRRNIRVKVMQTLYTVITSENQLNEIEAQKILKSHFDQTKNLFVYLPFFLTEVCRFAEKDEHKRASKHLPTFDDLHVNTKIAGNKIVWRILEDTSYKEAVASAKPQLKIDMELVKKIYIQLSESPEYKEYINKRDRDNKEERAILEFILEKLMLSNQNFIDHIEEVYSNWDDDGEMLILLIVNFLHKPGGTNFNELIGQDKKEFAEKLLETVLEKNEMLSSLIIPKLKNWDPERIAMIDMILMKMGVSEFLFFETIPPKVTINEYIDLAKDYSTLQSGHFVNGILDNIHKELVQEGKMQKVDYKRN
jgi:N utilization substance protein B